MLCGKFSFFVTLHRYEGIVFVSGCVCYTGHTLSMHSTEVTILKVWKKNEYAKANYNLSCI